MPISLKEQLQTDFLIFLREILASKEQIDISVFSRSSAHKESMTFGLSTLDSVGAFDEEGNIHQALCDTLEITFDKNRIQGGMVEYGRDAMPFREKLILDAVVSHAESKLMKKYAKLLTDFDPEEMEQLTELKETYKDARASVLKILSHGLRFNPETKQFHLFPLNHMLTILNQGFYRFENTNILISPGPVIIKDDLQQFFNNLRQNRIRHIFAVGKTFPILNQDYVIKEDFCNYFIPGPDGTVMLPLPQFQNFNVTSQLIEKVGRISTYEIRINQGAPIQIHHLPLNDKQPLELTDDELAYVQAIQRRTPQDQNILTHCRNGQGSSAQMAYILAAKTAKYSKHQNKKERSEFQLKAMRLEKEGDQDSRLFVETEQQREYLFGIEEKLSDAPPKSFAMMPKELFDTYLILDTLFRAEILRLNKEIGHVLPNGKSQREVVLLSEQHRDLLKLTELYHKLSTAITKKQMLRILKSAKTLRVISRQFARISEEFPDNIFKDQLVAPLQESNINHSAPVNCPIIYDSVARNISYVQAREILLTQFPLPSKLNSINYFIVLFHLAQGYLRQYKKYPIDMQSDVKVDIAKNIIAEVEGFQSRLASLKIEFEKTKNRALLVQWNHYQHLFSGLKETVRLYHQQVGDLFTTDQRSLLIEIEKIERIFNIGLDKLTIREEAIVLPDELPQVSHSATSQQQDMAVKGDLDLEEESLIDAENLLEITKGTHYMQAYLASEARSIKEEERSRLDLIHERLSFIEERSSASLATSPKLIIFDVDDTLVDLERGEIKNKSMLFAVLKYLKNKQPDIEIAICTNRTPSLDADPSNNGGYSLSTLVEEINKETGIVIKPELQLLYTPEIQLFRQDIYEEYKRPSAKTQVLDRLLKGKNYQLDELRVRYERIYGRRLTESECIFIDDSQSIYEQTVESTKYQAIKVPKSGNPNVAYLGELAYKTGCYAGLIQFLQGKTEFLNTDGIPNFAQLGFQETPLVRDIPLDVFYQRVVQLQGKANQNKMAEYKYDFTFAAISQFALLDKGMQDTVVVAAFNYLSDEIKQIQTQLNTSGPSEKLKKWLDKLMALEKQYAKQIGFSYLNMDLSRLQIRLNKGSMEFFEQTVLLGSEHAADKKVPERVLLVSEQFMTQRQKYMTELSNCMQKNTAKFAKQYLNIKFISEWSQINEDNYKDFNQFAQLIDAISEDFAAISLDKKEEKWSLLAQYQELLKFKLLLKDMSNATYTAKFLEQENGSEPIPYDEKISALQAKVDGYLKELEQQPQFQAMLFLEKAEKYIHSPERKWNVSLQKAIPKHVNKQLAEIKAAKRDGNFQYHMKTFIEIGRQQANSLFKKLFSSKVSKMYSSLFAGYKDNKDAQRELGEVFSGKQKV